MAWKLINDYNSYYEWKFRGPINLAQTWIEFSDVYKEDRKKLNYCSVMYEVGSSLKSSRAISNNNAFAKAKKLQKRIMKILTPYLSGKEDWFKTVDKLNKL